MKNNERRLIALMAQDLLQEKILFEDFCNLLPDEIGDNDVERLVSMIEHLPGEKGILGGNNKKIHDECMTEINILINKIINNMI